MRNIRPELVTLIDGKIASPATDPVQLMRQTLMALVGIHEEGGNNRGKCVELFQDTVGNPARQAWCMDFQQSAIAYVEKKLNVVCPLVATEGTQTLADWAKAHGKLLPHAVADSLIVWRHTEPGSTGGHVGYVLSVRDHDMTTVEGNTSADSKEIVREGDVVAMKQRPVTSTHNMVVRGFIPVTFAAK